MKNYWLKQTQMKLDDFLFVNGNRTIAIYDVKHPTLKKPCGRPLYTRIVVRSNHIQTMWSPDTEHCKKVYKTAKKLKEALLLKSVRLRNFYDNYYER